MPFVYLLQGRKRIEMFFDVSSPPTCVTFEVTAAASSPIKLPMKDSRESLPIEGQVSARVSQGLVSAGDLGLGHARSFDRRAMKLVRA
jgi:hypothetical protein